MFPSTMGLTPSEELYLYRAFIRAVSTVASTRLKCIEGNGTTTEKCFRANAVHDRASHPSDAFRYLSLSWRSAPRLVAKQPKLEGWTIPPPG